MFLVVLGVVLKGVADGSGSKDVRWCVNKW